MRKPHVLTHTTKRDIPYRVIFLDTETNSKTLPDNSQYLTLKLGYAIYCTTADDHTLTIKSEHIISDKVRFWQWVVKKSPSKTRLVVVAHNISFDMPVLDAFRILPRFNFKVSALYKKGTIGFVSFRNGNREILFVDNGNFYSGSLAKWGKVVGRDKLPIDFDHDDYDTLLTYCKNDTMIMYDLWVLWFKFLRDNDCGEFRVTLASTAFNTFRHRFNQHKIYIHSEESALLKERDSYHGGRVECFYSGVAPIQDYYYLDVNSMYPHVMKEHEYPVSLLNYETGLNWRGFGNKLDKYCVIADVLVETQQPLFAVSLNSHLCYPIGQFRVTLTTNELKRLIQEDAIRHIYSLAWYHKARIFEDYVSYFYGKRLEYEASNNSEFAAITKLLLNSLYGKFGQKGTMQQLIGSCDPEIVWIADGHLDKSKQKYHELKLGGSYIRTLEEGEAYDSFPAIASHVTANARLALYDYVSIANRANTFYTDTDSLITNKQGYTNLAPFIDPHKLGALKIEHQSTDLTINAPKDYRMGSRVRIKGIRSNAVWIDENTVIQDQWTSLTGMVRKGSVTDYTIYKQQKTLTRKIETGIIGKDQHITPFNCRYIDGQNVVTS